MSRALEQSLSRELDDQLDLFLADVENRRIPQRVLTAMNDGQADTPQVVLGAVGGPP